MKLLLAALAVITLLELLLWLPLIWRAQRFRKWLSAVIVITLAAVSIDLVFVHSRLWTVLVLLLSAYRVVNLLRIVENRLQPDHLRKTSHHSSLGLIALQLLVIGVTALLRYVHIDDHWRWVVVGFIQLVVALVLFSSTQRHLRTTKTLQVTTSFADRDLPSISVAIPARNETEDLEACLQALIASDYPKLEILVLDDCSQNQRTPEIIRGFAHDGVRFIAGHEPTDSWLAKNYAYERLREESSGDYLLFCGVDVRFAPTAVRELVTTLLQKQKTMLSVLPQNATPHDVQTYFVQPTRYAWELSLPRRLFKRPPVLSTCWLIKRTLLDSAGGFKAASRSITPESYLARAAARTDGYSFVRSNLVISNKPFLDQLATTIRTRYPQLHRRPELVALLGIAELTCLVLPLPLFIASLLTGMDTTALLSGLACLALIAFYSQVVAVTYRRFVVWNLLLAPFAGLYDIGLLHYSMWKYEFSEVYWKGRNVCMPVMRAIPNLPKL